MGFPPGRSCCGHLPRPSPADCAGALRRRRSGLARQRSAGGLGRRWGSRLGEAVAATSLAPPQQIAPALFAVVVAVSLGSGVLVDWAADGVPAWEKLLRPPPSPLPSRLRRRSSPSS